MKRLRIQALLVVSLILVSATTVAGVYEDTLIAARNGNNEKVIEFIRRGMDVNTADSDGTTLLMYVARDGNTALMEYLLNQKPNLSIKNRFGDSALMLATLQGHLDSVKMLIKAGAAINQGGDGWTPLNYAAFAGQTEIAAYLIEQGAQIDARAPNGMTSLMLAARNGNMKTVQLLLDSHANPSLTNSDGKTAATIALANNQTKTADLLVQAIGQNKSN